MIKLSKAKGGNEQLREYKWIKLLKIEKVNRKIEEQKNRIKSVKGGK
jgi:hypothetical protein